MLRLKPSPRRFRVRLLDHAVYEASVRAFSHEEAGHKAIELHKEGKTVHIAEQGAEIVSVRLSADYL